MPKQREEPGRAAQRHRTRRAIVAAAAELLAQGATPSVAEVAEAADVLRDRGIGHDREIGDVLRDARNRQGRTLREVSAAARVSLGYLSEVERGQKEASSELLGSICGALEVPLSIVLREVSDRIAIAEGVNVPDTVPPELSERLRRDLFSVA